MAAGGDRAGHETGLRTTAAILRIYFLRGKLSPSGAGFHATVMMSKPYRPNVGIALFRGDGRVLIARRIRDDGPEIILPGCAWQMPQGGIDPERTPRPRRGELWEETGVTSVACSARWRLAHLRLPAL